MRRMIATTVVALVVGAGSALAQGEVSLGWYEDNWEATTFPADGGWGCSVDSRADNFPDSAGAWLFVFPEFIQLAPNGGLPPNGVGSVVVDAGAPIPMEIYDGAVGMLADADDLPMLQAMAQGKVMTITVWPANAPNRAEEYVYPLAGFRDAFLHIAEQCAFDPSEVLGAAPPSETLVAPSEDTDAPADDVAPDENTGSSLFGRDRK